MVTEQMIKDKEFDALIAMTIAVWAGYAKKDNIGFVVIEEIEND